MSNDAIKKAIEELLRAPAEVKNKLPRLWRRSESTASRRRWTKIPISWPGF